MKHDTALKMGTGSGVHGASGRGQPPREARRRAPVPTSPAGACPPFSYGRVGTLMCIGTVLIGSAGCVREATTVTPSNEPGAATFSEEQAAVAEQRQHALIERWQSPISKVVVTRDDIAQFRDRRAGDILRRLPGVVMSSPGTKNRSARLRGLGTQYTQVLINGERISGSGEKRQFELDRIPADMIERIEIIKNPSAEFSSDAVAGIVNIILRQAPDPGIYQLLEELRRRRE